MGENDDVLITDAICRLCGRLFSVPPTAPKDVPDLCPECRLEDVESDTDVIDPDAIDPDDDDMDDDDEIDDEEDEDSDDEDQEDDDGTEFDDGDDEVDEEDWIDYGDI